jgi:hypothetical protein
MEARRVKEGLRKVQAGALLSSIQARLTNPD